MKKILLLIILLFPALVFASENIEFSGAIKLDSNYLASVGMVSSDGKVVKKDKDGNAIWEKTVSKTTLNAITATSDNYIVVVGKKIIKYDYEGNLVWEKSYDSGELNAVTPISDGGFVAAGSKGTEAVIVMYDKDGNIVKEQTYGGSAYEEFRGIDSANDGGFIAIGLTYSWEIGYSDTCTAIIAKFDKDFNVEWQNKYGGTYSDEFSGVATTSDGYYIAVGRTYSPEKLENNTSTSYSDAVIVKYDDNGNVVWENIYGGSKSERFKAVIISVDGSPLVTGFTNSPELALSGGNDAVLVKVDSNGTIIKEQIFGTDADDESYALVEFDESRLVLVGSFPKENEQIQNGTIVNKVEYTLRLVTPFTDGISLDTEKTYADEKIKINVSDNLINKIYKVKIVDTATSEDITNLVNYDAGNYSFTMPKTNVDVVIIPLYIFIEGENQIYKHGTQDIAIFKIDANFDLFDKVYVDGNEVMSENYIVQNGSVILKFKPEYLNTLNVDKHLLEVTFTDGGKASTNFYIEQEEVSAVPEIPETSDNVIKYVTISVVCLLVIGVTIVVLIKYNKSQKK